MNTEKKNICALILEGIQDRIRQSEIQLAEIIRRANEAPGAMQSHSDTDKNLYGRQAAGQKEAIETMKLEYARTEALSLEPVEAADIGSLIEVRDEKGSYRYFILPGGGGITAKDEKGDVTAVTPTTPLGSALLGKKPGEIVQIGNRTLTIFEIS